MSLSLSLHLPNLFSDMHVFQTSLVISFLKNISLSLRIKSLHLCLMLVSLLYNTVS